MRKYVVSVEREDHQIPIGEIVGDNSDTASFRYSEEYLNSNNATAISISLPLQSESFSVTQTKNYFEGLLPEGFTRHSVAQWMHLDENDYISILHGLGRECLGAIRISSGEDIAGESYEKLSVEQVKAIAAEGATKSTELVTKAHLSLTGASGKVGLYYNAPENEWYLPEGTAPSTHIVKQSHVRLDGIVTNEQLCLLTAASCGIEIPKSFIINIGNGEDGEVLFATERYDRVLSDSKRIDGLRCPMRLHQEDFAQAMGIPASKKYEAKDSNYLQGMFEVLRKYSINPLVDRLKLWDIVIFNYLIGNTDAHIKNFSLLYSPDMKSIRLAPAYDIVSTTVYESSTRDMAFNIGGDYSIDDITRASFNRAARDAGLGKNLAMKRYDMLLEKFEKALRESTKVLADMGFNKAENIENRILQTGGIRQRKL
jgi:serine/threonine-protein kinase HipA